MGAGDTVVGVGAVIPPSGLIAEITVTLAGKAEAVKQQALVRQL